MPKPRLILRIARQAIWLLLLAAAPAFGQAPLDASRLPADTLFYLHWRGTNATAAARETNSLLRLWADPEFTPAREAILQGFRDGLKKNKEAGTWTPDEILSLLENPLLIGYVGPLELPAPSGAPAAKSPAENRLFVIYDASGKSELLLKMKNRWLAEMKEPPAISTYAFGPVTVEKYVEKNQTFYRAQVGSYFVQAGQ